MKNMTVSRKLVVSFAIVVALAIVVTVIGVYGMNSINNADDALYNENVLAFQALGDIREAYVSMRVVLRDLVIRDYGSSEYNAAMASGEAIESSMTDYIKAYKATITPDAEEDKKAFADFEAAYANFLKLVADVDSAMAAGRDQEAVDLVYKTGTSLAEAVNTALLKCVTLNDEISLAAVNDNTALFQRMLYIQLGVLAVAIVIVVILVRYISGLISAPLKVLTGFMNVAGSTGNITMRPEDVANIERFAKNRDETGQCIASTARFVEHVTDIANDLGLVAAGDLTTKIHVLSDEDVLGVAMQKTVDNLNRMFGEINSSTGQVSVGAKQIADGAQVLAQGSTEQASAVEQLSVSITEIAKQTQANADLANQAAKLGNTIKGNAEKGSAQMDEMMAAVNEINQASQSIGKVIAVIDSIAFQTNILALNAAVEAARAGQHGKGFAVVAEEVRSLAAKSADAAKDTGGLIANSIEKAALGSRIAGETAASLAEIVSGINESSQLVGVIAKSSEEQAESINQVNRGIDQVAQVVQQNSATAQQSAAASEEMSGQASILEGLVAQFKLNDGMGRLPEYHSEYPRHLGTPQDTYAAPSRGDYGKY